ncbi:unnamed protein product, partial [Scytosiphon promiscuus]
NSGGGNGSAAREEELRQMVRDLGAGLGTLTERLASLEGHTRSIERAFRSTEGRHLRREFAPVRDEDEAKQLA